MNSSVDGGFQVDGMPLLFSALNPTDNAPLHLRLIKGRWLNLWTLVFLLIPGFFLLRLKAAFRTASVFAFITLLCLLGIFAPIFLSQVTSLTFYLCVITILAVWMGWHIGWVRPRDPLVQARKARRLSRLLAESKASQSKQASPENEHTSPNEEIEETKAIEDHSLSQSNDSKTDSEDQASQEKEGGESNA